MNRLNKTILVAILLGGCGDHNLFESVDQKNEEEQAAVALEKNQPDRAIRILSKLVEKEPTNYPLVSMLSQAYAQKYGIDPVSIALKMADSSSTKLTTSGNDITALFGVLPDASDENLAGVETASALLQSIPADSRTSADRFKITLFETALLALRTKKFDKNLDGQITPDELLSFTADDAIGILTSLLNAQGAVTGTDAQGVSSQAAVANIQKIQTKIDSQEGADTTEKLKNYLSSSGTTKTTTEATP